MLKRIMKSIQGRLTGLSNRYNSCWQEYVQYYEDGMVWDDAALFESFGGKSFQGNPYYVFITMISEPKWQDMELYIAHQKPEELWAFLTSRGLMNKNVHIIQYLSAEYRNVLCHAKYLVNNMSFNMNFIKKDQQVYVNTWHGTPLKTLGRTIKNDPFAGTNPQRNMLMSDILLAPNELTRRVYDQDYMVSGMMSGEIVMGGYPRNTAFFDDAMRLAIRKENQLDGKKAVFYMPTWRGTASSGAKSIDFVADMEKLAQDLGDAYTIYVKLHSAMSSQLQSLRFCKTMPAGYEVYEFLNAMDVLITDYSSVYFDFANTGRPIILYQYDREQYYAERGVYPEVEEMTPYTIVESYDSLVAEVRRPSQVDDTAFRRMFCQYDGPDASRQLLARMTEVAKKDPTPVDLFVIDFRITDEQLMRWKEQLKGKKYRFLLVPNRKNGYFRNIQCYSRLEYLSLFPERNIRWYEYALAYRQSILRERKRLWGNLKVGTVYSRSKRIPLFMDCITEAWPTELTD